MHGKGIIWTLAMLTVLFGGSMVITAGVSFYYESGHELSFFYTAIVVISAGLICMRLTGPAPTQLNHRDGFLVVTLAWLLMTVLGALPFLATGTCDSFVDAVFETASGLTTTGATVLSGLDQMPPSILFWRSMLQWLGGMGIIVLVVAVIPFLGTGGMQLLRAEVPGPVKDKLTTRVSETAKVLWGLYLGLTILCTLSYWWAGMSKFDAINHAMTTVSTGGFSTHDASFGFYGSPVLYILAIVFMLIASMNFSLHFAAMRRGLSVRLYLADDEFKFYGLSLIIIIVGVGLLVVTNQPQNSWDEVAFSMVSLATTTGFTVTDYTLWPPAAILIVGLVILIGGGCAGSTSGGMKAIRLLLLFRHAKRELQQLVNPRSVMIIKLNNQSVDANILQPIWGFMVLYMLSFFVIALMVGLSGVDVMTALSAAATCISNTGPGLAGVGPSHTFEQLPAAAKAILLLGMILGRLEVYTFLVLLVPAFWRR